MRMLGSVALGAGFIGLVSIPASIQAAWKTESLDDAPMVAQASSKRGLLVARELDGQFKAAPEITCVRGRQQLLVSTSTDLASDTIAMRYRINDQPQKQTVLQLMKSFDICEIAKGRGLKFLGRRLDVQC